jgi:hypothetical protein
MVASVMDLIDHVTKGRKQRSIIYIPRIRLTAPQGFKSTYGGKSRSKCRSGRGREFSGEL